MKIKIEREELQEILRKHKLWLNKKEGGERADLRYMDLRRVNLTGAVLTGANLRGAILTGANLRGADLRDAILTGADLKYANLTGAILTGAILRGANLRVADLKGADLTDVKYDESTQFFAMQCPEEGSFIAYKKCKGELIVKLLIPEDALRSSATTRKCRCNKAVVLEITDANGNKLGEAASEYDDSFIYTVGETISVGNFDTDRWNECAPGIHFFMTKQGAIEY